MPTITVTSSRLEEWEPHRFSTLFDGEKTPSKTAEIKTVADCEAALSAFAEELKSSSQPWLLMVSFRKGSGRKPAGFDAAEKAGRLRAFVNTHLAPPKR